MSRQAHRVTLEPTIITEGDRSILSVAVANGSTAKVTVVTLPRYLIVELKDDRGQFVRGEETDGGVVMPTSGDYLDVPGNSVRAGVFRLPISEESVGTQRFPGVPRANVVRVTYKADRVMPGLPRDSRSDFFAGPTEPKTAEVTLPASSDPSSDPTT